MHACYQPRIAMRDAFPAAVIKAEGAMTIARNTWQRTTADGSTIVRFHETDIVTARADGTVRLDCAGWRARISRDRMNDAFSLLRLPYRVVTGRGQWIVQHIGPGDDANPYGRVLASAPFADGMELPAAFAAPPATAERDLKKAINKFVELATPENIIPEAGDCFLCMFDIAKIERGDRLTPNDDNGHILSHIDEGYMHGSLVAAAMLWAGYNRTGVSYWLHDARQRGKVPQTITRALRRYLKFRLRVV